MGTTNAPDRLSEACRRVLAAWPAPDGGQERLRADFLSHLARQPEGWSRSCPGAHLTASSLICAPTGVVLLTRHARLGRWLQTGGHLEPGDASLRAAALREASEESGLAGLQLDPVPLLLSRHEVPCGPVRPTFHLDVQFLVHATEAADPTVSAESTAVRWFSPAALPEVDASVTALVDAAAQRLSRTGLASPVSRRTRMP